MSFSELMGITTKVDVIEAHKASPELMLACTAGVHYGEPIATDSFAFEATAAGTPSISEIVVTKQTDSSSPVLMERYSFSFDGSNQTGGVVGDLNDYYFIL